MTHLLENLLTASFHGSIVILAVIALRIVLRKTPKKYICLLWLLAGVRLLLPVQISSSLSLQPRIAIPGNLLAASGWISWIWIVVALCFAVYSMISYRILKQKVREAVRIRGGWESDRIETAFILGFIKPKIYIPMGMSNQNRKHILEHERTHLDKGDHWVKMIGFLALALHWFNPLVWIAYLLLSRDIEMACDERVVQFMEPEDRKAYSAALLSCSAKKMHFAASPVAFGEVSVRQRIQSILNYKKPGFWMGLCGVLAIAFVTLCLMTSPGGDANPTLTAEQQAQLDRIAQCREDLEEALAQDIFSCMIMEGESTGNALGETNLCRMGENTLWRHKSSNKPNPDEGRMLLSGVCYALQNGGWVQTDAADTCFDFLLEDYFWDESQVVLPEDGSTWTDRMLHFSVRRDSLEVNFTCSYHPDGALGEVTVTYPGDSKYIVNQLIFPKQDPFGYHKTAQELFTEAKQSIQDGFVSEQELIQQKEILEWGVYFRVDDDRLTGIGSDVAIGQDEYGKGVLSTTDKYWLEKKTDGVWETVSPVWEPVWNGNSIGIPKGTSIFGYINWSGVYGSLAPGDYRMGKTVRCYVREENYNREYDFYSEFTIYQTVDSESPEAAAAVERCYAAWDELASREFIHFKTSGDNITETWINGSNYLYRVTYPEDFYDSKNQGRVDLLARWNGICYKHVREDEDDWGSNVIGMKLDTMSAFRAGWQISFTERSLTDFFQRNNKTASFPEGVGIVSDEMVRFVITGQNGGGMPEYVRQMTYLFDEDGNLSRMEYLDMESGFEIWVEVYDTTAEEIDALIQSYTKDLIVEPFSWEDARFKYTDEEFNIREDSFVNKGGSPISNSVDAARLALKEYPNLGEYLSVDVSRDEDAEMWKVTIQSYVDYQATYAFRDVYLTDDGETKLLVYEGPIWYNEPRK